MTWDWIQPLVVYAIHGKQLAEHGGAAGIEDRNLIESALARPQQRATYGNPPPDAADLAAAYAFGIVRNHGFNDGNKRIAWILARLFLALNKCTLPFDQSEAYTTMMSLSAGNLGEQEFAEWLRRRIV